MSKKTKEGKKYHIGKSGMPAVCTASIRPCRYGGINTHYDSMAKAQVVADDLNEQITKLNESGKLGFATHGEHAIPTKETELTIIQVNNFKHNIIRLNAVYEKARADLLKEISQSPYGKLKTDEATASVKMSHFRQGVDTQALKEAGLYNDYLKDVNVSEHTQMGISEENNPEAFIKSKRFERKLAKYDGETVNFDLSINEKGEIVASEQTKKALRELKQFKETLDKAKELEKTARANLMTAMKENNVDVVPIGKADFKYIPAHTERRVDSNKLKEDGLYEEYSKQIDVPESLLLRFK